MANTNILIKRSTTTGVPVSLQAGELAYSYPSNTIFIGTPDGNGVVNVGGQYYTSQIDNATDAATGLTLVRRDATGNASFNYITANVVGEIIGNANSATQLQTPRNFSIDGGDITAATVSFNGTGDVVLNASLDVVPSLGAGTYGSQTEIPVIEVAANGRVMNVTTSTISTTLATAADSGTGSVNLLNDTLNLFGAEGLTSSATGNSVTFTVDDTVVRSNTSAVGPQTINTRLTIGANNDLIVTGNLIITGNIESQNVQQLSVQDPLIVLGIGNYFSDTKDIGFAAHYNDGANAHTGLIRDADGDKEYYFFEGYTPDVDATNNIDITDPSFRKSNVHANYVKANLIANTVATNTLTTTGNVNIGGDLVVTGDIVIDDLQVDTITANTLSLTNALTVPNGGTGKTSFTSGQIIVGSGTNGLAQIANTTYVLTGTLASNNTITSITVDAYGRFTDATATAISGLTVPQGGTGLSTITQYGITYGNDASALGVTAAAGASDQTWSNQILTVTNAGVPVWTTALDGGQF